MTENSSTGHLIYRDLAPPKRFQTESCNRISEVFEPWAKGSTPFAPFQANPLACKFQLYPMR